MRAPIVLVLLLGIVLLAPPASALPTPGLFCDQALAATGRLFPEAKETNDFVSYDEARCGLSVLLKTTPDWIKMDLVGKSAGWDNVAGGHDKFDVFVVRVSNYKSSIPDADKQRIVFQLSIHGNEKGGREGGLRVIEDFARDLGLAKDHPELRQRLDWMELLFVFPNPDGWTHEELAYRKNDACYFSTSNLLPGSVTKCGEGVESQNFVRVNGHGSDENRQFPTIGWAYKPHSAMHETEAISIVDYLKSVTNIKLGSDIHGMLNPADGTTIQQCVPGGVPKDVGGFDATCFGEAVTGSRGHFILTMLPAGQLDPSEMVANTQLADLVKKRLNSDPHFAEWQAAPDSIQGAWGGEFDNWGTVWDTIGYTDSGISSDWFAQDSGLNVPGVDFEMSYNHVTVDDYYPGAGMFFNDYHVQAVRDIVRAFMDQAATDVSTTIETNGMRTAWLRDPTDITNENALAVPDWQVDNPADDKYDAAHKVYHARPNAYFEDLQKVLRAGEKPGVLDPLSPVDITAGKLAGYDNFVVSGGAYATISTDAAAIAALKGWTEHGGHLFLADDALQMLPDLGAAKAGSVDKYLGYAGHTNFIDTKHPLAQGIQGLSRETYEPVPLGFGLSKLSAPIWFVKASDFQGAKIGLVGLGQGASPDPTKVDFGQAAVGKGSVVFLGALLPTPANADDVVYGVDSYATTYTGNQLVRNVLGWTEKVNTAPAIAGATTLTPASAPAKSPIPGAPLAVGLALVALAAFVRARRR